MRHRLVPWFAALALALAAPAPALAQDGGKLEKGMDPESDPDDGETMEGRKVRDEGDYGGVRPGQGPRDGKPAMKRPKANTLAWVGFSGDSGTARIFLQGTSEMSYSQRIEGSTLVVHVEGVKHLGRQVRRALETRYFDSPVARVTVKKVKAKKARKGQPARKAGIEIRVSFKQKADVREATARSAVESDGYNYVYLELSETTPSN